MGISMSRHSANIERKGKCKDKGVYASLFEVGAPEALVIGVVTLLVFEPKGLAEAARNLGKTLRAFQPTIRELQDVSRELKSSLEKEISLDGIKNPVPKSFSSSAIRFMRENVKPNESLKDNEEVSLSTSREYLANEYLKVTEAQLKGALAWLQKEQEEKKLRAISDQFESQTPS